LTRIAISGTGAITAAGRGVSALWTAACDGISGVRPLDIERAEANRVRIAANVEGFDPATALDKPIPRTCDRYAAFALVAATEAVAQSGLNAEQLGNLRTACIIGTGVGGIGTLDEGCFRIHTGQKVETFSVPRVMPSSATSHVSIAYGITGPTFSVTSACASASQSIGIAMQMIRAGIVDRAVVGGAEACITPATMRAWELLRVLSPTAIRPFSFDRNGMVIGEGAGVLVLESEAALAARGGTALAWLTGYGTTSDARDMIQPDPAGAEAAMRAALQDAALDPEQVGYVNAHGTGTVLNDLSEAEALSRVFADRLAHLPVSSSKPILGHMLGAGGAAELIVTVEALRHQIAPPQANLTQTDPKCPLYLPNAALPCQIDVAISNSFAFGGINAALVVGRA